MADYYQTLNIASDASQEQIQAAYHRERARLLAATGDDETQLAPALQMLEQAFTTLSDPTQRAAYDRGRAPNPSAALALGNPIQSLQPVSGSARTLPERPCPNCAMPNPVQATICAHCGAQISRPCPKCGNPVLGDERICSRCGTVVAEYDQQRFMQAEARKNQIEAERMATDARVQKQEQVHGKNRVFGVTFYAFILGLCIGVCALGGFLIFMSGR